MGNVCNSYWERLQRVFSLWATAFRFWLGSAGKKGAGNYWRLLHSACTSSLQILPQRRRMMQSGVGEEPRAEKEERARERKSSCRNEAAKKDYVT